MALQVWLPLNGDLHNQGLNQNVTLSAVGNPTIENDGKIGKCYAFDGSSYFQSQENFLTGMTECSLACWVKDTYTGNSWMRIFGIGEHTRVHLDTNGAAGQVRFFVSKDGSTGQYWGPIGKTNLKDSTWHHVCGTFDSQTCKIYIDGKCEATVNTGSLPTATGGKLYLAHVANGVKLNGSLNDIRVYDHALSPKEVEDISKALILHYPLNDIYNDNLILNSDNLLSWSKENAAAITFQDDGFYCIRSTASSTTGRYGIYKDITLEENTTYTFSVYVKSRFHIGATPGSSFAWNTTQNADFTNLDRYIYTFTTDSSNTKLRIYLYGYNRDNGETYVKLPKLEKGNVATRWCLSTASNTIIYDSSGYGNNGTIVGNLTAAAGSPRYDSATKFLEKTSKVKISNLNVSGFADSYSFAWWENTSNYSGTMRWGFKDGIRLNGIYNGKLWNTGDSSNNPLYKPGTTTQVSVPTANVWHHFVMVGNGSECLVYQDGELWGRAKTYKSISGTIIYLQGWDETTSYSLAGMRMSDFRIYATALTAEQIKGLYNTSMLVDASGNIMPRGLEEV